ncbi:uncharacterized protein G2W53_023028 [Senna tora]|uniref:Uncharacterized protein n=1 Tax=Senna tora TaxID=362788 RepID=A0A834WPW1_9FABA|nr:uncharacterized protein G2W53_023028 [Senna tora]
MPPHELYDMRPLFLEGWVPLGPVLPRGTTRLAVSRQSHRHRRLYRSFRRKRQGRVAQVIQTHTWWSPLAHVATSASTRLHVFPRAMAVKSP